MRASPRVEMVFGVGSCFFAIKFLTYKIRVRVGINSKILILIPTRREIQMVNDESIK